MAGDTEAEIPETGAVFTFGKSKFADNVPSKFWLKNDVPSKLACGDEHTALITEKGKLFMFGSNNWGQLGLGEKISVSVPTCVKALKSEKVKLVACGRTHTLVYTSCGNLYAAGGNNEGQLGLGDFGERTSFQLVDFFTKRGPITTLAAGSNTSAAITQDGKLYVWGDNSEGQIGLGKEEGTSTPRELNVGSRVTWVSCGYYHSAFVTEDGALFTFGERDSGKLGLSTAQLSDHKSPQRVEGIGERVLQVACGGSHTLALTEKHLYSFGLGQFGQLGHGTFTFESHLPRAVEHFRKGRVKHIECGENHSAVLTERGLLYTFGDGRHGKLALGEEYFANQFKPTLCPRFLEYNVQAVTCGGCHTIVLAKPRFPKSEDVILEEDDVTEDHLEKLLREAESQHGLNRSLSARDRRRERKRSPEQFGMMFRTLPPLSSAHRNASVPVSSQTFPSQTSKKTTNGFPTNGIYSSTDKVTGEHEVHGKTAVEIHEDDESVKDLGETADLLNLTHVMKMHPAEKTITFSPVQKKVKAGEKHSKVVKQLIHDPKWAGLSSDQAPSSNLRTSHVGESGEPSCRSDRRSAVKESRLVRGPASGLRDKSESHPKSKPEPQRQVIDIEPKSKAQIDHEVTVKGAETETEKEVHDSEGFKRDDLNSTGSKARQGDKRWRRATEEKKPREGSARFTRTKKLLRTESESKVQAKHEATAVQSKTPDNSRETWGGSSSSEQSYQAQRTRKTTKPERNLDTQKKRLGAEGSSDSVRSGSLAGVASLTEDLPIESPERPLEDILSSQFLSRTPEQSPNTVDEQTLSISENPEKTASKRTAVTITVKPVPAASGEETEKSMSQCQSEDDKGGESGRGRIDQVESVGRNDHEESKTEPEEEASRHFMEERENAEVGKTQQDEVESRMSEEEGSKEMDGRIESRSSTLEGEKGSSKSENVCDTIDDCSEGDKSEDESAEKEAGEEDSSEEESVTVRNEKTEEESGKESETEEDMTGGRSGKEEQESGTEGKDSEGEEKEMESEDGEESDVGKDESKEEEEESEASVEEEEESNAGCEEDSEAGKAESEEEVGESGENEEGSETEKEEGEEEEEESEAGNEESGGEEEESEAGNEESEGEEEESEAGNEESEGEEEKSEAGNEESEGEEEESEAGMEESGEEGVKSETGMEESGEPEEESGEKEEEIEREAVNEEDDGVETENDEEEGKENAGNEGVEESVQEYEDAEDKREEEEGGEDEDGKAEGDPKEKDKKENEEVATEEEGLKKKGKGNEKTSFPSKPSSGKRRSGSQEPRQFWDDVLPQYLNLK